MFDHRIRFRPFGLIGTNAHLWSELDKPGKLHRDDRAPLFACPVGAPTCVVNRCSASVAQNNRIIRPDTMNTRLGWSDQLHYTIVDGELVGQILLDHVGD